MRKLEKQPTARFWVFGTAGTRHPHAQWTATRAAAAPTTTAPVSRRKASPSKGEQSVELQPSIATSRSMPAPPSTVTKELVAVNAETIEHSLLDVLSSGQDAEVRHNKTVVICEMPFNLYFLLV